MTVETPNDQLRLESEPMTVLEEQVDQFINATCNANKGIDEEGKKKLYRQIALIMGHCRVTRLDATKFRTMVPDIQERFKQETGYDPDISHLINIHGAINHITKSCPVLFAYINEIGDKGFTPKKFKSYLSKQSPEPTKNLLYE